MSFLPRNVFLNLFLTTLLLAIIIVTYLKKKFRYWTNKKVYTEPLHSLFGHSNNVVRQTHSLGEELRRVYDAFREKSLPYGGYYAGLDPVLVAADLDLIKNILSNDFEHFKDPSLILNQERVNLLTLRDAKWRRLRAKLTSAFTSAKMKTMLPTLAECAKNLCDAFDTQMAVMGAINVRDLMARYTTDVTGTCLFGLECNSLQNPKDALRLVGKKAFDVADATNTLMQQLAFLTPDFVKFLSIFRRHREDVFADIIKTNVEYREKHNVKRNDVVDVFIELKNEGHSSNDKLTMNQLVSHCHFFYLAGFETSANTASFCLYELAVNASVQERAHFEVMEVLARHGGEITYDALAEMTYMDQCIYETLRKYPPIPIHKRKCTKSYKIPNSDVVLEVGTRVMISVLGIHRDPEYYPDPDIFDPERFSKENQGARHSCAWIPFGIGPRTCLAEKFGMLQIKMCLSALIRKYNFTLNAKTANPLVFNKRSALMLIPNCDVLLNIQTLN